MTKAKITKRTVDAIDSRHGRPGAVRLWDTEIKCGPEAMANKPDLRPFLQSPNNRESPHRHSNNDAGVRAKIASTESALQTRRCLGGR